MKREELEFLLSSTVPLPARLAWHLQPLRFKADHDQKPVCRVPGGCRKGKPLPRWDTRDLSRILQIFIPLQVLSAQSLQLLRIIVYMSIFLFSFLFALYIVKLHY